MLHRRRSSDRLASIGFERVVIDLERRWSEPHRRYHDLVHLDEMLGNLGALGVADDLVCELATWFHDAILDNRRSDNEERSAVLATEMLTTDAVKARDAHLDDRDIELIADIIRATKGHEPATEPRTAAVLDADMAILGSAPDRYAVYLRDVRAEYDFLDDEAFRTGRATFTRHVLEQDRIFGTDRGRELWEEPARRNLAGEAQVS